MSALGMLALGVFVGAIVVWGIQKSTWGNLGKTLATTFSAAFAGGVFSFVDFVGGQKLGDALFLYPMGLVLGLIWSFAPAALRNITSDQLRARIAGWGQILGGTALTLLVLALLFFPSLRDRLPSDEGSRPPPRSGSSER